MIYELRVYYCVPGKLPVVLARFEEHVLKFWEKHGIRQAGFFTTIIGEHSQQLTYLLAWESMAEREKKWTAFSTNPEWLALRAETEKGVPWVERVANQFLAPTSFSVVK